MKFLSVLYLVLLYFWNIVFGCEDPVVEVLSGRLRGKTLLAKHNNSTLYHAFKGIPYAKPPLGSLRFQPPEDPEPWEGERSAALFREPCMQPKGKWGVSPLIGSEDCLTLNVYKPEISLKEPIPVFIWIHGGSYIQGSGMKYQPDYLMEENVILVTINYRMGIFGFFSVGDKNAYGNMGFRDIIAALQWVQKNIQSFGGDPKKVTLGGQSAGCDAITMLLFSNQIDGLFQQYICHSGTSLKARNLQKDQLKYTRNLAKYFNLSTESTKSLVEELQKLDAASLYQTSLKMEATGYQITLRPMPWFPVIEKKHAKAIVSNRPYKLLKEGDFKKLPFIFGHSSEENTFGYMMINMFMNITDYDNDPSLFVSVSLNDPPNASEIGKLIRETFLGNSSATDVHKFSKYIGQDMYIRSVVKELAFKRKHQRGYCFLFNYKGSKTSRYPGVGHGEELQYVFYMPEDTKFYRRLRPISDDDILIRKRTVRMWTNFIKHGNPTPQNDELLDNVRWVPCDRNNESYLRINVKMENSGHPNKTDLDKWDSLFDQYAIKPFVTY